MCEYNAACFFFVCEEACEGEFFFLGENIFSMWKNLLVCSWTFHCSADNFFFAAQNINYLKQIMRKKCFTGNTPQLFTLHLKRKEFAYLFGRFITKSCFYKQWDIILELKIILSTSFWFLNHPHFWDEVSSSEEKKGVLWQMFEVFCGYTFLSYTE